jgi:FlaA1/EpsC-like NDP-sugar epimerase
MFSWLNRFFTEKRAFLRMLTFLIADSILIIASAPLSFLVRFEFNIPSQYAENIFSIIILSLLITLPVFYFSKLYNFTWAYVSTEELVSLSKAMILSFLIVTGAFFVLREQPFFSGFPRSTLFISYSFIFVLTGTLRFSKRIYSQAFKKKGKERILIIGAGRAGEQILRSILSFGSEAYNPIGFVDDDPTKKNILIHGLRVFGKMEDLSKIVQKQRIEGVIVAVPSAGSEAIKFAVDCARKAGIKKIKIIPPMEDIISGKNKISIDTLKDLDMEDLLERNPVVVDNKLIKEFIEGKKVLITGAAGSIGSELCKQTAKFNPATLLLLDQDETGIFNITGVLKEEFSDLKIVSLIADIQDEEKVEKIFKDYTPEIVFHAAAYKHVPLMESYPEEAVKNNVFGTLNLARASLKNNTSKFIFISTDKAVNPSSVMGTTKRIGEMICQKFNQENLTKFMSVRFGNVLGSRGSVIPIFRDQIRKGGPVQITNVGMKRYFMITSEACLLVMQAGAMGKGGEVFVLDMGSPIRIVDLAEKMIRLSGLEPNKDIAIVFTDVRPGEKMFEELLTAEEGTVSTKHEKIFVAKLLEVDGKELNTALEKLKEKARISDGPGILDNLKKIVPNYSNK